MGKRVLRGRYNQGQQDMFGVAGGAQCTSIALMFLLMSVFIPLQLWQESDLTHAMFEGTYLHSRTIHELYPSATQAIFLSHEELPSTVNFMSHQIVVHVLVMKRFLVLFQISIMTVFQAFLFKKESKLG